VIRTNEAHLIESAALVEVHPHHNPGPYGVASDGVPFCLPGSGGIVYNVRVGDSAYGWVADHIEPGVSALNPDNDQNLCLQNLVCVGNWATVVTGDAKGEKGTVVGKHGGAEHTLIDFPRSTMEKLVYGDKIMLRLHGKGLIFEDYPGIRTLCISPRLLKIMGLSGGNGKLIVPVVARVPPQFMGSGLGMHSERSDYDIMTADRKTLAEHGLDRLRMGDFVALMDHDNRFGRCLRRGAITIGVIGHGDCHMAGHGPGVVSLFTSPEPVIEPVIDADANVAIRLGLREDWKK
jgi:hypothetical protein